MDTVTVLGSTGSIGGSTLSVLQEHSDKFSVYALTANTQLDLLAEQCAQFNPQFAVITQKSDVPSLKEKLRQRRCNTAVLAGLEGLKEVASADHVDTVVAAIVGAAGLEPTMSAVKSGKRVLLANKESLVMCGRLFTEAVNMSGAELLPVDSEHNAIFQCLPPGFSSLSESGVKRILLTGSGGPFLNTPLEALGQVTPAQAVAHPNWSMGRKISVDSATMMNKGLEFIEACWLFSAGPAEINIVVHPQSIIHSMVEYVDGSIVAQMGRPDMRTPIAHCLGWPSRIESGVESLDLYALSGLDFCPPDYDRFPCVKMAVEAMSKGGTYSTALNAANEIAVESFLNGQIRYLDIAAIIESVLSKWNSREPDSLGAVKEADLEARRNASTFVSHLKQ